MGRKIRSTSDIADSLSAAKAPEGVQAEGVVFINNFINREFVINADKKFKFTTSRQLVTDPEVIAKLTELAATSIHRIFIETPEPAPEPEPDPEEETESESTQPATE